MLSVWRVNTLIKVINQTDGTNIIFIYCIICRDNPNVTILESNNPTIRLKNIQGRGSKFCTIICMWEIVSLLPTMWILWVCRLRPCLGQCHKIFNPPGPPHPFYGLINPFKYLRLGFAFAEKFVSKVQTFDSVVSLTPQSKKG